jgi:nucleotide-binding universal stress UspA family protein
LLLENSRVLLAYDGSPPSNLALAALEAAHLPSGTPVRVVCVGPGYTAVPPAGAFIPQTPVDYEPAVQPLLEQAQRMVEAAADRLRGRGWVCEALVRRGEPGAEIVSEAEGWSASLVVLGSHGRSGLDRWLLGSVAEYVVRHAPCSVHVVRSRAAESR